VFDWAAIIPQYQALWAEQNARRLAAPPLAGNRVNPFRPDPFTNFQSYPTAHMQPQTRVAATGMPWSEAKALLSGPLASYSVFNRPTLAEAEQVVAFLAERPEATAQEVAASFSASRSPVVERGLLWLARYGVIRILPS
jgi:hypothetical protein